MLKRPRIRVLERKTRRRAFTRRSSSPPRCSHRCGGAAGEGDDRKLRRVDDPSDGSAARRVLEPRELSPARGTPPCSWIGSQIRKLLKSRQLGGEVGEARDFAATSGRYAASPGAFAAAPRVAHQQAAGPIRRKSPLVRIERDRVAPPSAGRVLPRERPEEGAVRRVGVDPQSLPKGDREDLRERVDRPRVRRPGVRDHEERLLSVPAIALDRRLERGGHQSQARVDG
jgi:hypothetical protein